MWVICRYCAFYIRDLSIRGFWYSRGDPGTNPCQMPRDSCNCEILNTVENLNLYLHRRLKRKMSY